MLLDKDCTYIDEIGFTFFVVEAEIAFPKKSFATERFRRYDLLQTLREKTRF